MKLNLVDTIDDIRVYNIIKNEKNIGSIELIFQDNINTVYIENVVKDKEYTGTKLVKEVCELLRNQYKCNIACLPLQQYRKYYESLGFKISLVKDQDVWYTLDINTQIP